MMLSIQRVSRCISSFKALLPELSAHKRAGNFQLTGMSFFIQRTSRIFSPHSIIMIAFLYLSKFPISPDMQEFYQGGVSDSLGDLGGIGKDQTKAKNVRGCTWVSCIIPRHQRWRLFVKVNNVVSESSRCEILVEAAIALTRSKRDRGERDAADKSRGA
ncbi:hypothetical protein B0H34DRAFT_479506 [Crassisporium funariophilum]|nr:hypothetical protein B0H34DRAFT_479506 [Crassisporium funariophilum]